MFNYDEMKKLSREKKFFLVSKDGSQIPMANIVKKGRYYRGTNIINDIPSKLLMEDLGGYFTLEEGDTASDNMYRYISNHLKTVADIYATENLSSDNPYFYASLEIYKKIICAILNKNWDEIALEELKEFWRDRIKQSCAKFEEYIENELSQSKDNPQFVEELNLIKKELNTDIRKFEKVNEFELKEDLCKFWPTLLMPAPGFVNL